MTKANSFSGKLAVLALGLLPAVIGCGPAIPDGELGTKRYEMPRVPGTEQPYQLPELGPPDAGSEASDPHAGHGH